VIANGTNDIGELHRSEVGHPSIDRMIEEYEKIVSTIKARQPNTAVVVAACVPTRGHFSHLNESIKEYNERTREIAEKYKGAYVDVHSPFVDEEGNLKEEFSTDGLHITEDAKTMWVELISRGIEEGLRKSNEAGS